LLWIIVEVVKDIKTPIVKETFQEEVYKRMDMYLNMD
jgi:hypothetical protein